MPLINQISIPRFDSLLSKLLGIKERQIAPSVASELVPVLPVQDPASLELAFVKGEQTLWANDTPFMWGASVAAIHPVICFGNPTGSGKLITIEKIQYYAAPDVIDFSGFVKLDWIVTSPHAAGFGGVGVGFPAILNAADWNEDFIGAWRDTRWWSPANLGGNQGHALRYFAANKLAAGIVGGGSNIWSGGSSLWSMFNYQPFRCLDHPEVVLSPGAALRFQCTFRQPLNIVIKFDFAWRERPLEDSEVRPGSS